MNTKERNVKPWLQLQQYSLFLRQTNPTVPSRKKWQATSAVTEAQKERHERRSAPSTFLSHGTIYMLHRKLHLTNMHDWASGADDCTWWGNVLCTKMHVRHHRSNFYPNRSVCKNAWSAWNAGAWHCELGHCHENIWCLSDCACVRVLKCHTF